MSRKIYTDGSCMPNPGFGGYGFVVFDIDTNGNDIEWHVSGGEDNTTNNRMELTAVIEALKFCEKDSSNNFTIYSDSMYVINCAKGIWNKKKNIDLWEKYLNISKHYNINWVWVKGHSNDKYNNIVDYLAKKEVLNKLNKK